MLTVTLVGYDISVVNMACDLKALGNVTDRFLPHLLDPGANSGADAATQLASQVGVLDLVTELALITNFHT